MLHPEPFPDPESWCAARHADAVDQLASSPADLPKVLVNHSSARGAARHAAAHPPLHPLLVRTRNWHRRFNACAVVYGHLHIRGSTGSTAHRSRRPRSDIPGNGTAEGEWAPICARSCWPPGRPRSDTGSAPRSGGVPTGRVRVCSSCTSTSGPIRPPNNGFSPFSTLTSGHAGAGSGSRSPSVSSRRAARHSASTSANGGGARTRTRRSVSLSTASRSLGWAGSPRTRTST